MAALLHAPLLKLTTLMVALNLILSPMLIHTQKRDREDLDVKKSRLLLAALEYAVSKYNENSDGLYQDVVVITKDFELQVCDPEVKKPEFVT